MINNAVENRDGKKCGEIVEMLRIKYRMNYEQCAEVFKHYTRIDVSDFEELMYMADMAI